jgi:hypothetical protein
MSDLFSYPHSPGFKTNSTSRQAAQAMTSRASILRDRVEQLFLTGATLTADECAAALHESVLAIRPRLSELVKKGLLVSTGERRKNASGMSATVWRAA